VIRVRFKPPRRKVRQGRQFVEINGFDLDQPEEVCDFDGLDEDYARRHFQGKYRMKSMTPMSRCQKT
jgi:hypothetical protein